MTKNKIGKIKISILAIMSLFLLNSCLLGLFAGATAAILSELVVAPISENIRSNAEEKRSSSEYLALQKEFELERKSIKSTNLQKIKTKNNGIYLRVAPSLVAGAVEVLDEGALLNPVRESNNWVEVVPPSGNVGWLQKSYFYDSPFYGVGTKNNLSSELKSLKPSSLADFIINDGIVTLFSQPTFAGKIVEVPNQGMLLVPLRETDNWLEVMSPAGKIGWINKEEEEWIYEGAQNWRGL